MPVRKPRIVNVFEEAALIASEVSRADDHILTVEAKVAPTNADAMHITVSTIGTLSGTGRLEFRSLEAIDDAVAALRSVRNRVAEYVEAVT